MGSPARGTMAYRLKLAANKKLKQEQRAERLRQRPEVRALVAAAVARSVSDARKALGEMKQKTAAAALLYIYECTLPCCTETNKTLSCPNLEIAYDCYTLGSSSHGPHTCFVLNCVVTDYFKV